MPQSASACLHPRAVPLSVCPSLLPLSPGMRWLDTSGMAGKVGMGLGMLHEPAWLPQISLQPPRGAMRGELELCSLLGTQEEEEEEDAQARLAPGARAEVALAGRRTLRISRLTRSAGASITVMVVAAQGCAV